MRKIMRARMRDVRRDEGGFVLITVIITAVALSLLVTIALDSALAQTKQARRDQDFQGALAAAEAGVDDYLSYLNNNNNYFDVVPTGATDPNYNPASDPLTAAEANVLQWPLVPGSAASTPARFHYAVDKSTLASTGEVTLEVTGNVGKRFRTVKVKLGRLKFTDYVYFSDVEVNDPYSPYKYLGSSDAQRAAVATNCMRYAWVKSSQLVSGDPHMQVRQTSPTCATIGWTNTDTVYGPFHTNDLPIVDGGTFTDRAEAGCPPPGCGKTSGSTNLNYSGSGGSFAKGGMIAKGVLPLPASNSDILKLAQPGQSGCLYTGPTRIILKGSTFDVYSSINQAGSAPLSKSTNGSGCGTFTKGAGGEWSAKDVPIPANGVVYVQGVPTASTDPNYTAPADLRAKGSYPYLVAPHPLAVANGSQVTSPAGKKFVYSPGQSYEWPLRDDDTVYEPNAGDVFVEGVVDGRLTIATSNNVVMTGDLTYASTATGSDDLLGLVAQNSLWLYHPIDDDGGKYDLCPVTLGCMKNIRIHGAIMSVTHGFGQQWPDNGLDFGTIRLFGSLTQAWRNNVGGGNSSQVGCYCSAHTGYAKDYRYDPRLNYSQPPHFLKPQVLAWTVKSWSEVVG